MYNVFSSQSATKEIALHSYLGLQHTSCQLSFWLQKAMGLSPVLFSSTMTSSLANWFKQAATATPLASIRMINNAPILGV